MMIVQKRSSLIGLTRILCMLYLLSMPKLRYPTSHGMLPAALPYLWIQRGINPYFNYSYLHTAATLSHCGSDFEQR